LPKRSFFLNFAVTFSPTIERISAGTFQLAAILNQVLNGFGANFVINRVQSKKKSHKKAPNLQTDRNASGGFHRNDAQFNRLLFIRFSAPQKVAPYIAFTRAGEAMFVLRAAFWITIVAVLMPRAPGLASEGNTAGPGMLAAVQTSALENLTRVRADLKARHAHEP